MKMNSQAADLPPWDLFKFKENRKWPTETWPKLKWKNSQNSLY